MTPRWDFPLPRLHLNRVTWRRRFWLAVPHRRVPYLNLKDEPLTRSVLAGHCRRCGR